MSEISAILPRLRAVGRSPSKNYTDRAAVIAIAILQIVDTAPDYTVRQQVENYLRDEIADLENRIIAEREVADA